MPRNAPAGVRLRRRMTTARRGALGDPLSVAVPLTPGGAWRSLHGTSASSSKGACTTSPTSAPGGCNAVLIKGSRSWLDQRGSLV